MKKKEKYYELTCLLLEDGRIYKHSEKGESQNPLLVIKKFVEKYLPKTNDPIVHNGGIPSESDWRYVSYRMEKLDTDGVFFLSCRYLLPAK